MYDARTRTRLPNRHDTHDRFRRDNDVADLANPDIVYRVQANCWGQNLKRLRVNGPPVDTLGPFGDRLPWFIYDTDTKDLWYINFRLR